MTTPRPTDEPTMETMMEAMEAMEPVPLPDAESVLAAQVAHCVGDGASGVMVSVRHLRAVLDALRATRPRGCAMTPATLAAIAAQVGHADRERLAGYVARLVDHARAQAVEVESERRETDALRAIVEGRRTPPTEAELLLARATGGRWRAATAAGSWDSMEARDVRSLLEYGGGTECVWWALDATRALCAWPTGSPLRARRK